MAENQAINKYVLTSGIAILVTVAIYAFVAGGGAMDDSCNASSIDDPIE